MLNYVATIQCINFLYTFCHYKTQFLWCTFQTHFSMRRRQFQNMFLILKYFHSFSPCHLSFDMQLIYSQLPYERPPRLFFQKFFQPHCYYQDKTASPFRRLLGFLLCESNLSTICMKKYFLSKKVISKASLKILEVNIRVQ